MSDGLTLELPARRAGLRHALERLEDHCARCGVGRAMVVRLLVIVEELFTNTIKYGYGGECDRPVRVAVVAAPAALELAYEDEAPPFDPTRWTGALPDAEHRPVGRTGIALVLGMVREARYEPRPGGNRLVLRLAPDAAAGRS
jgi:serine/threonine-protein kinase RsbW